METTCCLSLSRCLCCCFACPGEDEDGPDASETQSAQDIWSVFLIALGSTVALAALILFIIAIVGIFPTYSLYVIIPVGLVGSCLLCALAIISHFWSRLLPCISRLCSRYCCCCEDHNDNRIHPSLKHSQLRVEKEDKETNSRLIDGLSESADPSATSSSSAEEKKKKGEQQLRKKGVTTVVVVVEEGEEEGEEEFLNGEREEKDEDSRRKKEEERRGEEQVEKSDEGTQEKEEEAQILGESSSINSSVQRVQSVPVLTQQQQQQEETSTTEEESNSSTTESAQKKIEKSQELPIQQEEQVQEVRRVQSCVVHRHQRQEEDGGEVEELDEDNQQQESTEVRVQSVVPSQQQEEERREEETKREEREQFPTARVVVPEQEKTEGGGREEEEEGYQDPTAPETPLSTVVGMSGGAGPSACRVALGATGGDPQRAAALLPALRRGMMAQARLFGGPMSRLLMAAAAISQPKFPELQKYSHAAHGRRLIARLAKAGEDGEKVYQWSLQSAELAKEKHFVEAVKLISKCIDLLPCAQWYLLRAVYFLCCRLSRRALKDIEKGKRLDREATALFGAENELGFLLREDKEDRLKESQFRLSCQKAKRCWGVLQSKIGSDLSSTCFFHPLDSCFCPKCRLSSSLTPKSHENWVRFGIRKSDHAKQQGVDLWKRAYHGTSISNLRAILEGGATLLYVGDVLPNGHQLGAQEGHFQDFKRASYLFVSPSLSYAAHPVYSWPFRANTDEKTGNEYQIVLEVRVKPGTYIVQEETVLEEHQRGVVVLDESVSNDSIEWKTKRRCVVHIEAVLIRVMEEEDQSSAAPKEMNADVAGLSALGSEEEEHHRVVHPPVWPSFIPRTIRMPENPAECAQLLQAAKAAYDACFASHLLDAAGSTMFVSAATTTVPVYKRAMFAAQLLLTGTLFLWEVNPKQAGRWLSCAADCLQVIFSASEDANRVQGMIVIRPILALQWRRKAIQMDPSQPLWWIDLSTEYEAHGNLPAALSCCVQALSLDANLTRGLCKRGQLHRKLGNYRLSMADFTRALELNPSAGEIFQSRASTRFLLGDFSGALEDERASLREARGEFAKRAAQQRIAEVESQWQLSPHLALSLSCPVLSRRWDVVRSVLGECRVFDHFDDLCACSRCVEKTTPDSVGDWEECQGWTRFAIGLSAHQVFQGANKWERAFCGSSIAVARAILHNGAVPLFQGDILPDGSTLGNPQEDRREDLFLVSERTIYTPSLKYCSKAFCEPEDVGGESYLLAFEIRVDVGACRKRGPSVLLEEEAPGKYSLDSIEWTTNRRCVSYYTGLLVREKLGSSSSSLQ